MITITIINVKQLKINDTFIPNKKIFIIIYIKQYNDKKNDYKQMMH